jgi:hypothetical protein
MDAKIKVTIEMTFKDVDPKFKEDEDSFGIEEKMYRLQDNLIFCNDSRILDYTVEVL